MNTALGRRRPGDQTLGLLALIATTTLWATSFVFAKVALADFPPVTLVLLRCLVAYAALRPVLRHQRVRAPLLPDRSALFLGLTGIALPIVCHNLALRWSTTADATLVHNGALPVLTGLLALLALGERPGSRVLLGLAVSVAGVTVVAGGGAALTENAVGTALVFAGTAAFALFTVAGRRAFTTFDWLGQLDGMVRAAVLLLLPIAAVELIVTGLPHPSLSAICALLYLGAGCTALAQWLNALALRRLEAGRVAVIGNLELPLGIAASAVLLGEAIGATQMLGAAATAGGAWLAMQSQSRPTKEKTCSPTLQVAGGSHRSPRTITARRFGFIRAISLTMPTRPRPAMSD